MGNKNYKKNLETRFSIGNQKNLKKAFAVDLRKGRGCGSVLFTRKIEFGLLANRSVYFS
jgi:hypothetical protein